MLPILGIRPLLIRHNRLRSGHCGCFGALPDVSWRVVVRAASDLISNRYGEARWHPNSDHNRRNSGKDPTHRILSLKYRDFPRKRCGIPLLHGVKPRLKMHFSI
jgi:hypothetical protein